MVMLSDLFEVQAKNMTDIHAYIISLVEYKNQSFSTFNNINRAQITIVIHIMQTIINFHFNGFI